MSFFMDIMSVLYMERTGTENDVASQNNGGTR